MSLVKHWKGKHIELTNEIVYILVQKLNSESEDEADKDIILSVYKTEDAAVIAKEVYEERAKEHGFDNDVFAVKSWNVWK
jgi:hypothetical protein